MAKPSFEDLKDELDEACASLREFTLGQTGITERKGATLVRRVSELCDQMGSLFKSGKFAQQATTAIVGGRAKAGAAQARLNLLKARRDSGKEAG